MGIDELAVGGRGVGGEEGDVFAEGVVVAGGDGVVELGGGAGDVDVGGVGGSGAGRERLAEEWVRDWKGLSW